MTRLQVSNPINGLPELFWQQSPNFNLGAMHKPRLVVVHDTEGGFEGAISTFANSHSQVSAHFVLKEDGTQLVQMVSLADKAWHVVSFNAFAVGIEMAGFAAKGFSDAEWQAAARVAAFLLHHLDLPPTWVQKGAGEGICRHYDLGRLGGGHTDPCSTETAPWKTFMGFLAKAYAAADWPTADQWRVR
jgi:N-acetyl-anhydromuramyl-L-alanine amidase AmpD